MLKSSQLCPHNQTPLLCLMCEVARLERKIRSHRKALKKVSSSRECLCADLAKDELKRRFK